MHTIKVPNPANLPDLLLKRSMKTLHEIQKHMGAVKFCEAEFATKAHRHNLPTLRTELRWLIQQGYLEYAARDEEKMRLSEKGQKCKPLKEAAAKMLAFARKSA